MIRVAWPGCLPLRGYVSLDDLMGLRYTIWLRLEHDACTAVLDTAAMSDQDRPRVAVTRNSPRAALEALALHLRRILEDLEENLDTLDLPSAGAAPTVESPTWPVGADEILDEGAPR
jgi:hypothetical protein